MDLNTKIGDLTVHEFMELFPRLSKHIRSIKGHKKELIETIVKLVEIKDMNAHQISKVTRFPYTECIRFCNKLAEMGVLEKYESTTETNAVMFMFKFKRKVTGIEIKILSGEEDGNSKKDEM